VRESGKIKSKLKVKPLIIIYRVILSLEAPNYRGNAEHGQIQVTGRVQYIAGVGGWFMLFSIAAGMCI